jgi:PST family polysaccharide transporter
LQAVVVRELVRRPEERFRIVASSMALRLLGAVIAGSIAQLAIQLSRPGDVTSHVLVLAIALSLLPQSWDIIEYDYQARMHVRPIVLIRSFSLVVFSVAKLALIAWSADVSWFAFAVAAEAAVSAIGMRLLFRTQSAGFHWSSQIVGSEMLYLLRHSWPSALAGLSVVLYMRIDQVMLGMLLGDGQVGVFSAAVRISESLYFIPMAVLAAVAPALTAAHAESNAQYNRKLIMVIRVVVLSSLAVSAFFSLFAKDVVSLLYGPGFEQAGAVLAIHAWAGVFAGLGVATGPWFVNASLLKLRMMHTIIGAVANIALNSWLIPRHGVVGAAVATLVSYSLAAIWLNALSGRTLPILRLQFRALLFR